MAVFHATLDDEAGIDSGRIFVGQMTPNGVNMDGNPGVKACFLRKTKLRILPMLIKRAFKLPSIEFERKKLTWINRIDGMGIDLGAFSTRSTLGIPSLCPIPVPRNSSLDNRVSGLSPSGPASPRAYPCDLASLARVPFRNERGR